MTAPERVPAGDRPACERVECHLPAVVRVVGTAVRGELLVAKLPGKPLAAMLMEPVILCRGHAIEVLASTVQTWEA